MSWKAHGTHVAIVLISSSEGTSPVSAISVTPGARPQSIAARPYRLLDAAGQPGTLALSWGGFSRPGSGKANEDFYGLMFPDALASQRPQVMVALADGLSADGTARPTIEASVLGLIEDFYATPSEWTVAHALDRLLCA